MRKAFEIGAWMILASQALTAQSNLPLSPEVQEYVKIDAPIVALAHLRVIDGTGGSPRDNQTIVIEGGKIREVGDAAATPAPVGAKVIELAGATVIPGLIDMHGHLFYTAGNLFRSNGELATPGITLNEMAYTYPRLYLACGVTSLRTTGSIEPYTDLNLKKWIDEGRMPGPKIHVTSPYLEGAGTMFPQMHELTGPEDARRTVNYWADEGVTSFKAYMNITRAELGAAIEEAHKRGLKVTGHLCSVSFREAAELGIDDFEHGPLFVDTEFVAGKKPDSCPPTGEVLKALAKMDVESPEVQSLIRELVARRIAITSTLPVFELDLPNQPPLRQEVLDSMLPESRQSYLALRERASCDPDLPMRFQKEEQFERAFVKAGGVLLAGSDPTGVGYVVGGDLAGFGMQRQLELLVEADFTPVEAIRIGTANNAEFLGESAHIGTIATGKQADLVILRGNPAADIEDIEKVEMVFKDGVGYDSAKLVQSVKGMVGLR